MITCHFEDGGKTYLRHISVNGIIVKNKKILLGKRGTFNNKKILEYGKWGLIGGYLDRDEDLKQGLKREVMEETGWGIGNLKLFRINDSPLRPAEDRQNVDIIFIARAVKRKKIVCSEEILELKWFDLKKLPPKNKIAFDHAENLKLYKKYLKKKFNLPLWGKLK